jgi:RimJ/RimL family protein N-acetyltransferase
MKADTFFIDPDVHNPRAEHVYQKAGFKQVGEYYPTEGAFIGHKISLMVKKGMEGICKYSFNYT